MKKKIAADFPLFYVVVRLKKKTFLKTSRHGSEYLHFHQVCDVRNASGVCGRRVHDVFCSQGHREHCHGMSPSLQHLITIRLKAVLFNITTVQAYAPISNYDDNKIEEFYDHLQNVIDQTPKKDTLVL